MDLTEISKFSQESIWILNLSIYTAEDSVAELLLLLVNVTFSNQSPELAKILRSVLSDCYSQCDEILPSPANVYIVLICIIAGVL